MTRRILSGMQKAAHVCCDSEATRDELLERRLMPRERVSVVRLGVHPSFHLAVDSAADKKVKAMLSGGASGPVRDDRQPRVELLHVGSTIPRKRIDVLLETFARIKREIEPRARLLRVGGAFTAAQQIQIERLGLQENSICVLPFLSPAELAAVYRRADVVLVPSETEGFGLPVIEALACGTPVIASDLTVLREVGGDAASYARMADVNAWLQRTGELLTERQRAPALWEARRERARRQGARFSWAESAAQMVRVYRAAIAAMESEQCG
jgi:glycosyltransferase involved in cell wall biosynthesis